MISKIIKNLMGLLKSESAETMQTPIDQDMVFYLTLKNLEVGQLRLHKGTWTYTYSDAFKHQDRIRPLVDFPASQRVYEAEALWPFFASRIPTLNQPYVQEVVNRKRIDATDAAAMLKEFGHRTITNPFALQAAGQD